MMHSRISNHVDAQLDVYISTPLSSNRSYLIEKAIETLFKHKEIRCVHWWENGTYDPYVIKKCDIIITIDPENQWTQTFSTPGMLKELTPFTKEIPSSKIFFGMYKRQTDGEYCFYSVDSIYKDTRGQIHVALGPGSFRFGEEMKNIRVVEDLERGVKELHKEQIKDRRILLSIL